MQVRELYERFLPPPDQRAGLKYESALQLWERHSNNPIATELTDEYIADFRQRCAAAGIVGGQFNGCWRYIHSILKAGSRGGVVVPYLNARE